MPPLPIPTALAIAGSDSSGGAGLQADLKAIEAHGVYGLTVVTAVTAQNTRGVDAVVELTPEIVTAQLDAVASDIQIGAVKTGMLASTRLIEAVAEGLRRHQLGLVVVDPVMIAKSGHALLHPEAIDALRTLLFPLAQLVTPNAHEAGKLAGFKVQTLDDARQAAQVVLQMGPEAVLVKGGHLDNEEEAIDVLLDSDGEHLFKSERIDTHNTHGTGCTYASAIAAGLARGFELREAIDRAKRYLTEAIRHSLALGSGHGPTHHFWFLTGDEAVPGGG